ncbi:MAG TPA: hypothetical protein PLK12_07305 [Prolixibacteraceae bacterium]|nr:hypothetical protein [Prolixibacteraceae bacterium]
MLQVFIDRAIRGNESDVNFLMNQLTCDTSFAMTRYVDYAISRVEKAEGMERIRYYLFNGTPIQRNYASLFFNRRGDWKTVKEAYDRGLIDEIQAFAR